MANKMQKGIDGMIRLFITLVIVVLSLTSCKTKYVSVPEYHTEYVTKTDTLLRQDSVYLRDSVFVLVKGDTVFIYKTVYKYRDKILLKIKSDTIIKRDSIPVPIVRELTKNEQRLISIGKYSIIVIITLIVILVIYWYRNKT